MNWLHYKNAEINGVGNSFDKMEYTLPTYRSELTKRNWQKAIQELDKNTAMYLQKKTFSYPVIKRATFNKA